MKKPGIKNIIIVGILIASLFSGNIYYSVYCIAEECCKSECCDESSSSVNSGSHLTLNNSDCCEYSQSFENEVHAVFSLNTTIKSNTTTHIILQHLFPDKNANSFIIKKSSANLIPGNHSISILRI